jgi:hypothetical protein
MQLVVQGDGVPATAVEHHGLAHHSRWPSPGMVLPVTVDRSDPSRLKIEWDEMEASSDRSRRTAEGMAAAMRGEGAPGGAMPGGLGGAQVINLSGRDLSQLSEDQKAKLRMLGIDPSALAAAQGAQPAASPPPEPAAAGGDMDDRLDQLERLARLREQGLLTEDEFMQQKRLILEG